MNSIGSENKPLEVAIIGSGPSGYYAAQSLFGSEKKINITMFDRLPTPYGLVRGGVAPDHQKIIKIKYWSLLSGPCGLFKNMILNIF